MKRFLPIGLIAVGFLLIFGAMGWLYLPEWTGPSATVSLPDSIAGLELTSSVSGPEALAEFENLHGKQFPITSGAIGIYGNRQITLWAAGAPSETMASEMTNAMREKIAGGNSPFTRVDEINDNNRTIYVLEGMGQKHYYFQSKNLVIWMAADPAFANEALQQVLEEYP